MNLRIGRIGRFFAPGYACCHRCRTPWAFIRYHVVRWPDGGGGFFPCCVKCWPEMTVVERIEATKAVHMGWEEAARRHGRRAAEPLSRMINAVLDDANRHPPTMRRPKRWPWRRSAAVRSGS